MTAALRPAPSARNVAFNVIRDVFGPDARGAAESLDRHLRKSSLDPRDRAFVTELAYGTIERRRWLDWQLEPYLGARAAKLPQMIAEILRLGTYQLRAMRVHEYAAVSESVQLARRFGHPGTAGLVNAVLRRVSTDPERRVDVSWDVQGDFKRPVTVRVLTIDRPGLLADISATFSGKGVNISQANCRSTGDDRAVNTFEVSISDVRQLNDCLKAIGRIQGVFSAERV